MIGKTTPTRDDIAKIECTANPIFLFQKGNLRYQVFAPIEYDPDIDENIDLETRELLSDEQIIDEGWGWIEWTTEHVWATREEAEEWGRTHAYRYRASEGKNGKPGIDWRVYCVPCCGSLSEILAVRS